MWDVDVSRKRKNYFVAYQYLWSNYFFSRLSSSVRIFSVFCSSAIEWILFLSLLPPFFGYANWLTFPIFLSSSHLFSFFSPIQIPSLIHSVHLLHIFLSPPLGEKRALNLFRAGNEQMLCWGNPEFCCWCFRCVITGCHISQTQQSNMQNELIANLFLQFFVNYIFCRQKKEETFRIQ